MNPFPAIFIGHGSPMNAVDDTEFSRGWETAAKSIPQPRAIVCISAHWQTTGTYLTAMEKPRTIYDFYGFPPQLYEVKYPAPGAPKIANLIRNTVHGFPVNLDLSWGLDHGAWSVLRRMFPSANIPVIQLSLDVDKTPEEHYALACELTPLRDEGILFIGSGNIVHNLGMMVWEDTAYAWAEEFDSKIKRFIIDKNHMLIINYDKIGRHATLAVPTQEHFLPLLYILALQGKEEHIDFFNEKVTLGSMSMRCLRIGKDGQA